MREHDPARLDVFGDPLPLGALARCGTHRFWHAPDETGFGLHALCFSPDSRWLLSAGGASVRIWDLEDGRERGVLSGHRDLVREALYVSSERIVTGGHDGTVRWWDAQRGTELRQWTLAGAVRCLTLCPDGRTLLAGTDGPSGFAVLDLERGELLRHVCSEGAEAGTERVVLSPDGLRVFTLEQRWWRQFSLAGRLCAFDWETGARQWAVQGLASYSPWLQCSPDGQRVTCNLGGHGHPSPSTFEARTGAPVRDASAPRARAPWVLPNGGRLRMRDEGVELLQEASGGRVFRLPVDYGCEDLTPVPSPDGRHVALMGGSRTVLPLELSTGRMGPPRVHRGGVRELTFSRDGTRLLTFAWDGTLRVWDSASGEQVACHEVSRLLEARHCHMSAFHLAHGAAWVGTGSPDLLLDLLTGTEVELEGGFRPYPGTWSGDGVLFAHVRGEEEEDARVAIVHDARTGRQLRKVPLPVVKAEARALSRHGRFLATWEMNRSSLQPGGVIRVWDLERQTLHFEQHLRKTDVWQLRFTADDAGFTFMDGPSALVLVDLEHPERRRRLESPVPISATALSEDGRYVALAQEDGQVRVCGVDGRLLAVLEGHRDDVRAVAFSADGGLLASGSSDTTALIWARSAWERGGR